MEEKTYTDEELKQLQKIELDILKEAVRICEKLDIEYFLDSGTLLGAIRHGGFIPWDDDIDIGMTREHYKRFLKEAPKYLSEGYYLQTPYDSHAPYYFSKIRKDGTEFVEYCNRKVKQHHGIYIDIFPYDDIPDDVRLRQKQYTKMKILTKLFTDRQSNDVYNVPKKQKEKIKAFLRKPVHILLQLIPYRVFMWGIEKNATRYNQCNFGKIANLSQAFCCEFHMDKKDMFPLKKGMFEDMEVNIPNHPEKYLEIMYGNYMELPPEKKRCGHKPYRFKL